MAGELQLETSALDAGITRVRPAGELDFAVAPQLEAALDEPIGQGRSKLLVDLSDAAFIDSTALGVLLRSVQRLRALRGRLAVLCPDPRMRSLFEIVGHNLIFPVEATLERALDHLGGTRRLAASPLAHEPPAG